MKYILWQTPIDLFPPYSSEGTLGIHYGTSLVGHNGTVVVTVRTGPSNSPSATNNTFKIEGRNPSDGSLLYTQTTDYNDPPHDWIPSMGSAIAPDNRLYTPGAGGTVYIRSDADSASASVSQVAFYGIGTYNSNQTLYNSDVRICTPITVDNNGNIYFGYFVTSGSTTGLKSGIARISSTGVGTYVSADTASGLSNMEVGTNSAPAVSIDGNYIYVAVKGQGIFTYSNPRFLRLDSTALTTASNISLVTGNPGAAVGGSNQSWILDDSTACPLVGPDGDVFFGIWYNNLVSRGFTMHYSADLSTFKNAGAFGWDDTPSIVPASAVPSYTGTSTYLIMCKYNNYSDEGVYGDGQNKLAVLDPNATQSYTVQYGSHHSPPNTTGPTYTVMKEVLTVLGITPNAEKYSDNTLLDGVREWCINTAAIDVLGKAAIVNSEDGHCYRWDFTTNTLSEDVALASPTGEAYTPTAVTGDGLSLCVNNANVLAIWDGAEPGSLGLSSSTPSAGDAITVTLNLRDHISLASATASGPGAVVSLSSSNPNIGVPATVTVPAGASSVTFTATTTVADANYTGTVTVNRYGFTATSSTITAKGSGLSNVSLNQNPIYGSQNGTGTITLLNAAPSSSRVVTMSSDLPSVFFDSATTTITSTNSGTFGYHTTAPTATATGTITCTLDSGATISKSVTVHAAEVDHLVLNPTSVAGGQSFTCNIATRHAVAAAGITVNISYGAHTSGPATTVVPSSGLKAITVNSSTVTSSFTDTITVSFESSSATANITVHPSGTLSNFTCTTNTPYMLNEFFGNLTLTTTTATTATMTVTTSDTGWVAIHSVARVLAGQSTGTFSMVAGKLTTSATHSTTVTVTYQGVSIPQTITIQPIFLNTIALASTATLHNNQTVNCTVTLAHAIGPYNTLTVPVSSSNSGKLTLGTCVVASNGSSATFTITAKNVTQSARLTVTATLCGTQRQVFVNVAP